ncbi:MAG TPA: beta-L-arabinofuranosidase domain-containing protein [Candidatus Acidoferrales bacterium]
MTISSRRQFMKNTAFAGATALAARPWHFVNAAESPAKPLPVFAYWQVQITDGILRQQFEDNHQRFLNLDEDAMLKPFRQRSGLPAPGPDMGGWYDNSDDYNPRGNSHGFIPGHSFGQYVSGLSRAYAVTGDKATQAKIQRLVRGYAETVEPTGKFYKDYRLPAYTFDKTCCGLIDAHEFAADPIALDVLKKSTDAVLPYLPEKALSRAEQSARPHKDISYTWDETYTLPENFFLAYQRSKDPRYRELGERFIYHEFYDPLATDDNAFPGMHAYSHVNTLSSAMQSYFVLGDDKYLRAAANGLRMVQEQSYATGGWGPNEAFVEPGKGQLAASLNKTHAAFETPCGAYGHFKIARYLLRVTRDSRYGDSMERVLYNTVAGAKPILADGTSFYYSDYNNANAKKVYYGAKWPCCSGTFPQITADYGISSYFPASDGIYVNLYIPSKVTWAQNGTRCAITQQTSYPRSNVTQLEIETNRPETFAIYLRVPAWTDASTRVSVNGKVQQGEMKPGAFLAVRRLWKNHDRVTLELGMPVRLEAVDAQTPTTVALLRGPLALFAVGTVPSHITRAQLLAASAVSPNSDDCRVQSGSDQLTLRPFTTIADENYRLYLQVES